MHSKKEKKRIKLVIAVLSAVTLFGINGSFLMQGLLGDKELSFVRASKVQAISVEEIAREVEEKKKDNSQIIDSPIHQAVSLSQDELKKSIDVVKKQKENLWGKIGEFLKRNFPGEHLKTGLLDTVGSKKSPKKKDLDVIKIAIADGGFSHALYSGSSEIQ